MGVASIVVNVNKGKHARIQRVVVGALGPQNYKTVVLFRKTDMNPPEKSQNYQASIQCWVTFRMYGVIVCVQSN